MTPFVAGVGSANIDLMFSGLPRLPNEGEELYADEFSIHLGGGVLGTLLNVSRLGIPVRAGTYLGDDIFSRFVLKKLEALPITIRNLYKTDCGAIPINISVAAITPQDRTFLSYTDKKAPTDNELQAVFEICRGARIVDMQMGYIEVCRKLKEEGAMLIFDMAWEDTVPRSVYESYLELADYWTANRQEALKFTGCKDVSSAARVLRNWLKTPLIKLDAAGCLIYNGGERIIPPIGEFTRIDSTGAGDAFRAGLIYGLYHQMPIEDAVLMGNITGGKCVTAKGALSAFVSESELRYFFEKYRGIVTDEEHRA
ncbi:carbohydrate kinase family protein [Treponema sp. TIM-1]|uniref:carbohydrate kinase family protein n=1 Tax=Treponema sp. TIM-1 TaxID=2898417 RepID=UPI00397F77C5